MPERYPHLRIERFSQPESFRSRTRGSNPEVPRQNRQSHARLLQAQYSGILEQSEENRQSITPISENLGVYVEVIGQSDCELPLDSLDTKDFILLSCKKIDGRDVATIYIPEEKRSSFHRKLNQYIDPEKDSASGKPRNQKLIDSIASIRLASLRSFWTDAPSEFPTDPEQEIWWELWLKDTLSEQPPYEVATRLAERIGADLKNTSLSFFDNTVVLIKASARKLEQASELISSLDELRRAKDTPNVLVNSSPRDQHDWVENLLDRIQLSSQSETAVCLLDTGVNYNHPLLSVACDQNFAESWDAGWHPYEARVYYDHGSRQAGLALFGDLHHALITQDNIHISHRIESARILPPNGNNEPELYGAITVGTAAKHEIARPSWQRVFSLAVTSAPEYEGGLPSSWSAEIDRFTFGLDDEYARLFVVSAGNNPNVRATPDYWDQVQLEKIQDPAQSWNALTVGAYTEKTTNDDPSYEGWSAFARAGDVSPSTTSAVNWEWGKHAPYKPDIVAEGGNRLLSPARQEIADADTVSLLTTSGNAAEQLFDTSADTSAACALVSRQAAILMSEYPDYWPETIRGLLIHSAEWTPRMYERFGVLRSQNTDSVAKKTMLKIVGYGVADLVRAQYSANHLLTLVAQHYIQPFAKIVDASNSADPTLNEMHLYELPWPIDSLGALPLDTEVKLHVTLSYFIEPNPGRRGYRNRYRYQSHGLRFSVIRPNQDLQNFRASLNQLAVSEDYEGVEGDAAGWKYGPKLRTRGSIHSDIWIGTVRDLIEMNSIAVYPVGGWWKYCKAKGRWENSVRYSLIVSIDVPDEETDIYTEVQTSIMTQIEI